MQKTLKEEQLSRISGGSKVYGSLSTGLGSITANPPTIVRPPVHDGADTFRETDA